LAAVVTPPSSIRTLLGTRFSPGYFAKAQAKAGAYELVWTVFRLRQAGEQVPFAVVEPVMGPVCSDVAQAQRLVQMRNTFMQVMEGFRMRTPDLDPQEGN
jgi:hypothetical protein